MGSFMVSKILGEVDIGNPRWNVIRTRVE